MLKLSITDRMGLAEMDISCKTNTTLRVIYRYDNGGYRSSGRIEDIKGNFVNGLRSYEANPDYLKNRNMTAKPDILNFLKKKRLENPFKKHDLHFNSATPSRNGAFIPYS